VTICFDRGTCDRVTLTLKRPCRIDQYVDLQSVKGARQIDIERVNCDRMLGW
jgi:hypothetical protein